MIAGIIAAVVILLLAVGGVAYALFSQQSQEQEQTNEQENVAVSDSVSEVTVYITADGTNEKSGAAKVVISSLTDDADAPVQNESEGKSISSDSTENSNEQAPENRDGSSADANGVGELDTSKIEGTIIQQREITPNETVSLGQLDPGDYRLTVVSVPVNEDTGLHFALDELKERF